MLFPDVPWGGSHPAHNTHSGFFGAPHARHSQCVWRYIHLSEQCSTVTLGSPMQPCKSWWLGAPHARHSQCVWRCIHLSSEQCSTVTLEVRCSPARAGSWDALPHAKGWPACGAPSTLRFTSASATWAGRNSRSRVRTDLHQHTAPVLHCLP